MLRYALLLALIILIALAFWRLVDGILEGVSGRRGAGGVPGRGVQMVRDPVCGVFVLPERAVTLTEGGRQIFFCSSACRDKYRAPPA